VGSDPDDRNGRCWPKGERKNGTNWVPKGGGGERMQTGSTNAGKKKKRAMVRGKRAWAVGRSWKKREDPFGMNGEKQPSERKKSP